MGGIGSGRQRWTTDQDTVACPTTTVYDAAQRYREGKIKAGDEVARPGAVLLAWTPCHYGGQRPWYLCPGEDCGQRVRLLYEPEHTARLLCRRCYQLRYPSQRLGPVARLRQRNRTLAAQLGQASTWLGDIRAGVPPKPRGMHWRTYDRLLQAALRRELAVTRLWAPRSAALAARVRASRQRAGRRRQADATG